MGKFDGLVDETLAERGVRTSASLTSAIDVQPDQAAEALAQSKRFGIPAAALGGRPDPDLGTRATLEDNSAVIAKSPTLGSWLASNPTAMQIAQDDLPGLSAVDETVRVFTRGTRALAAGAYARLPEGLYGAGQAITEPLATADTDNLLLSPTGQLIQPLAAQLSRFFTWGRKGSAAEATRIEGDQSGAGTVEQAVYSGLQSVGVNIGPLALSVMTGNPTPALATMATVTGGSSYGRARDAGLEPVAALPYAINDAAIEYVTERIPLVSLLGELKAGSPFYRILADQMVKEGLTEQAATFLQDANAWAAINPEKTAAEFLAERPNAALQTAIATAVATGLQTGAVAGVQRIAQRREQKLAAAEDAQSRLTETLTELNTLAEASKVRERDVDTFESFVTEATKDGPVQDVFISADALAQSGVLDQVAALSPSVAQQFATAQATGGMVRIPLAEVVGRLGGETAAPLLDHLKTDPNGFSKAEADEYVKEHAEALKADVERELAKQGVDDEFNASRDRVASGILAQLSQVNRFTEDVNKPYASLVAARYATLAQQLGVTPEEVAQQYPLRIVGESVTGLDQQQPQIDTPEFRNWFGDSKVADAAGQPLVVYHGTPAKGLRVFDASKIGENGRAEGAGFYFTTDREIAAGYGQRGEVVETHLAIKKPLDYKAKPFSQAQIRKLLAEVARREASANGHDWQDGFLSNYENTYNLQFDEVVRKAAKVFENEALALDQIGGLIGSGVDANIVNDALTATLGYDGYFSRGFSGEGVRGGDIYVAFRPEQIKSATGNSGAFDPNNPDIFNQSAFHGTPHNVDKFSLHKIGSGEGAQAYGWGLYFAGKREVAEHYRKTLSDSTAQTEAVYVNGQKTDPMSPEGHAARLLFYNDRGEMRRLSKVMLDEAKAGAPYTVETAQHQGTTAIDYYTRLKNFVDSHGRKDIKVIKGQLYKVDLPEDDQLLDYDKSLNQQPESVKAKLKASGVLNDWKESRSDYSLPQAVRPNKGGALYALLSHKMGGDQAASQYLNEIGIKGMRYKAGQIAGVKGGGHNYVIWDEAAISEPTPLYQSAYHGSPYRFDKFSLDHMGKGEGAQAYGWGLYFAGKREVAEYYRQVLANRDQQGYASAHLNAKNLVNRYGNDPEWAAEIVREQIEQVDPSDANHERLVKTLEMIESGRYTQPLGNEGQLYEVNIPEDGEYLLWDKPLSEQPAKVREALEPLLQAEVDRRNVERERMNAESPGRLTHTVVGKIANKVVTVGDIKGQAAYEAISKQLGSDEAASKFLNSIGIAGIKYLDGTSRPSIWKYDVDVFGKSGGLFKLHRVRTQADVDAIVAEADAAGMTVKVKTIAQPDDGSYNYVIFDDNAVEILNTFYQNQPGKAEARGSFNPSTLNIALLEKADLSTFLHETGHFFLEIQAEIASQPNAPAAVSEDMDRILKWFGIEATPERTALDVWRGMTLNEQREHHEKFARGFEAYLFEGKAPNVAMRGVFQRFRAWMLNVYRELKNLNVQLNDEIRGVFDRMIASEQEIADAEAGRSMGMLFESAEEAAKFGVDWRQYHDQGLAATNQAVSELQAKSLGDMRWLTGARARLLKKMQKEAARERREVRATVRGEVLAQPVYRAWTFLSGKSDAPVKKRNVDVDPEKDSLFEAIRKLGGINKDEVVSTWGTDPADLASENRVRTRQPLAPAKAGMTIDGMAEVLSEFGYLGTDEHGKWDIAQFEEKFDQELRGTKQWSFGVNPEIALGIFQETVNIDGLARGKLDTDELRETYGAGENAVWRKLVDMGMTSAKRGLPADGLAEQMGFTSGDEMITALVSAQDPATVIEAETDKRMLELHGDTYTPEGMALAVDEALHNAARTRMTATELSALEKAGNPRTPAGTDARGRPRTQATLPAAAKAFAEQLIAKLTPRTLLPAQYAASAERARKAATKALKAGNVAEAALEKRNQLVNEYAAKAAHDARDELTRGLDYLKGFAKTSAAKRVDADYLDQIHAILEKFDLRRAVTLKEIDKRKSLADWIAEQEELGIEPELPPHVRADALRVSYKELSLEQFRGVVDSVRQIEHLGKLKKKLLLARDARELEQVLAELKVSIADNAPASEVENRTRNTAANRAVRLFTAFVASHRKVASLARQLDGFKDGGPMWEHFIRNMNERGDFEATRRAAATNALAALLAPVSKAGRMSGKGIFIKELGLSLNREERITVALNVGNAGNMQRLMDGRGWSQAGVSAVLDTLTKEEWDFVQGVWDHFETYRPEIAAKQRRVFGFEPEWVEPQPVLTKFGQLRGGYYPIVYDARESLAAESNEEAEQAQRQLKGAKVAATTRRTFTKNRAEAVKGRPLLLTMDGMFRGVNDVIHDLAWHEWIIDSNRILRGIDPTVRAKYGADVVRQFKDAVRDIAAGEQSDGNALNRVIGPLRTGASVAGLGFNLVNVAMQGLGITQTIVRIGPKWTAKGVAAWVTSPRKLVGDVFERSEFMRNRVRTLNREINELQSVVRDKNKAKARLDQVMFWPMQMFQMGVDMPTWWGAYQKALAEDTDESRAVALADQAVIDAQGSGQVKDLAGIQRGPEVLKLFTVFYGFFSTTYNLAVERGKATKLTNPMQVARLAVDYLVLFSVPAVLGELLRQALAGGDDDEEKLAGKLAAAQVSYLMGTMVGVREASGAVQSALGIRQYAGGYGGPAGLRFLQELDKLGQQVGQGEFDRALVRTAVNVAGVTLHLPSAQINRTLDGVIALEEGKTDSPMALIGGVPAAQR